MFTLTQPVAWRSMTTSALLLALISGVVVADVGEVTTSLGVPAIDVHADRLGTAEFAVTGEDIQWLGQAGEPRLPHRVLTLLLPPNADLGTVNVRLDEPSYLKLAGRWNVSPMAPPATRIGDEDVVRWPADRPIVDGRDVAIYTNDQPWPARDAWVLSTGRLRQWRLVQIAVPLMKCAPPSGELFQLESGRVVVAFEHSDEPVVKNTPVTEWTDSVGTRAVRQLAVNYATQSPAYARLATAYAPHGDLEARGGTDYVIMTTDAIRGGFDPTGGVRGAQGEPGLRCAGDYGDRLRWRHRRCGRREHTYVAAD